MNVRELHEDCIPRSFRVCDIAGMESVRSPIYQTTNRNTNLLTRICVALLVITLFPICFGPIGYVFLQKVVIPSGGNNRTDNEELMWTQPLSMM